MVETELQVELDLDRNQDLTPEQFDAYAREVIWTHCRRQPGQSWCVQRTQLANMVIDPEKQAATWKMLEHVGDLQEGRARFRLSSWLLKGPCKQEPWVVYEHDFIIERYQRRSVQLVEEQDTCRIFLQYFHAKLYPKLT